MGKIRDSVEHVVVGMAKWCRKRCRLNGGGGMVAAEKVGGSLNISGNLKQVKWEKQLHGGVVVLG